ncbi:hypothetical protein TCAL_09181 [Tigriopus californicus]|uniref:Uncharacterized protein n=1 Tax=Tigriopus californicus TaxID=6832 RepID=A0A553PAL6_TIGCA|nr:uncharacterized protein LOC131893061 isoform X1 [Tigriopus californicus]TRY74716.1 hypothetical protein TCAL_09181 [Tigriopus californicus]
MEGPLSPDNVLEILDRLKRADLEIKQDVKKLQDLEKHTQERESLLLQKTQVLAEMETSLQIAKSRLNTLKAKDKLYRKQTRWVSEFQSRMKNDIDNHWREVQQMDRDLMKEKNIRHDILNEMKKGFFNLEGQNFG